MNIQSFLEKNGLNPNEAKIYDTLLGSGSTNVKNISFKTGIHRRNVYDVLIRLIEKGLVIQKFSPQEKIFEAITPMKLKNMLDEKQRDLSRIMPELMKRFQTKEEREETYIFRGKEGFKNHLQNILDVGENVYIIGAKGFWFSKDMDVFRTYFQKEAKRKEIEFFHIFDHEMKNSQNIRHIPLPHKFFSKKFSSHLTMNIYGDFTVLFRSIEKECIHENMECIMLRNQKIADGFRMWFRYIWENI
jgi:sugar-specific transcriptional regulator TrmB